MNKELKDTQIYYGENVLMMRVDDCLIFGNKNALRSLAEKLTKFPSAEPERKIIYCKDCKFAHLTTNGEVKYCDVWFPEEKTYLSADNFCSSAELRGE